MLVCYIYLLQYDITIESANTSVMSHNYLSFFCSENFKNFLATFKYVIRLLTIVILLFIRSLELIYL